VTWRHY